jgi:hypothetical protein
LPSGESRRTSGPRRLACRASLSIATEFCCLLKIPAQLKNVVSAYLFSLALNSSGHTQTFASEASGLDKSQFSRLLKRHGPIADDSLIALSQKVAKAESYSRGPLVAGAPWTIGITVDATLHARSSLHVHNSQRFNHGQGYITGHQWTCKAPKNNRGHYHVYLFSRINPLKIQITIDILFQYTTKIRLKYAKNYLVLRQRLSTKTTARPAFYSTKS